MKDFMLSKHNLDQLVDFLSEELESTPIVLVSTQNPRTGKWGMARLWRLWMEPTAKYMRKNGASMPAYIDADGNPHGTRDFNAEDAHQAFTAHWMGTEENGDRLSWSKAGRDGMRAATKGERFMAMMKHEDWAIQKGIVLFKPRNSEYARLNTAHDGG